MEKLVRFTNSTLRKQEKYEQAKKQKAEQKQEMHQNLKSLVELMAAKERMALRQNGGNSYSSGNAEDKWKLNNFIDEVEDNFIGGDLSLSDFVKEDFSKARKCSIGPNGNALLDEYKRLAQRYSQYSEKGKIFEKLLFFVESWNKAAANKAEANKAVANKAEANKASASKAEADI